MPNKMKADKAASKPLSKKGAKASQVPTTKTKSDKAAVKSSSQKRRKASQPPPTNSIAEKEPEEGLSQKLVRRFYEVLVLLRVLGQVQGEKLRAEPLEDSNVYSIGSRAMRRNAMYHMCVACDFEKGGDSVTALACENVPSGPRYWMASNKHVEKIKTFLMEVLAMLGEQASSGSDGMNIAALEDRLFEKFVLFQRARIKEYWRSLQKHTEAEVQRAALSPGKQRDIDGYVQWLHNFQHPLLEDHDYCNLSQSAYDTRHSDFVQIDFDPLIRRLTRMENPSRIEIRHCIGRLGAPRRAAAFLANAAMRNPDLFLAYTVQAITCEAAIDTSERFAEHPDLNLDGICRRMFSSHSREESEMFRSALKSLDESGSIMHRVRENYQNKKRKPRIHAELAVLETLHDRDCTFYDDDKFVACSKPACFCCYHYICAHPGSFERPSCHNKVYPNWCPPAYPANNKALQEQQRDIMNKLVEEVRKAITKKVFNAERGSKWHPDSSTGITPSIAHGPDLDLEDFTLASGSVCDSPRSRSSMSSNESSWSEDLDDDGGVSLAVGG